MTQFNLSPMNFSISLIRTTHIKSLVSRRCAPQSRISSRFFHLLPSRFVLACIACFLLTTHGAGIIIQPRTASAAQTHPTAHPDETPDKTDTASDSTPLDESVAVEETTPSNPQTITPPVARDEDARQVIPFPNADKVAPRSEAKPAANPNAALATKKLAINKEAAKAGAEAARAGESLRETAARLNLPMPLPAGRIVILKSRRRLELWNGNVLIKTYHVALGASPQGHKKRQGDKRTPEGEFKICTRNASTSAFHIFLGLDYPAVPDASRALKDKTISWREYQAIRSRLASRSAPLWSTRLGGWVGIHGGSGGAFARRRAKQRGGLDWTAGCIAVRDREIEEIHAATRLGTSVSVRP